MELSICANYLQKAELSDKSAYNIFKLCKDAGFTVIDYTPGGETWEQQVVSLLKASEAFEMPLEQSHAPFNRYRKLPLEDYKLLLDRAFEAAIRMGNKQIVIHGDDYRVPKDGEYDAETAMKEMYELWAPYVEKASNNGVCVAIETVFEDNRAKDAPPNRFTSRLEELKGLIDRFDNPMVTCCWDSGHARLAFTRAGMPDAMRALGSRITSTHIHDNYYNKDLHVIPFQGDIDWREQMATLKEIGYKGNLTYELVYGKWPESMVPEFLKVAADTGKVLIDWFNKT
ncbi:MAG: sugar phosphate isomerase/epimerase [Ruminococcaceae bacterium]|nr:sugar phosphate isomerase/epimerase [Oscillospiraceae bacterium]